MIAFKPDMKEPAASVRPTRDEAEAAVRTLLLWAGEDPEREGLIDTPARVVRSYEELFKGYEEDPRRHLARTFQEVAGYQEMIILKNIRIVSTCEHHMLPVVGLAHVAYVPKDRVVGISKLARVVSAFSARLQIQEAMTAEIASAIEEALQPLGVGVAIRARHSCMSLRGVSDAEASLSTCRLLGSLRDDARTRAEFMRQVAGSA